MRIMCAANMRRAIDVDTDNLQKLKFIKYE